MRSIEKMPRHVKNAARKGDFPLDDFSVGEYNQQKGRWRPTILKKSVERGLKTMKMIKILNWILSILGGIILIVLIILILPWNLNKADAEETAPPPAATMDTVPETEAPTMPPAPDTVLLKDASVGDYVFFGHYEQDNNEENGKEEIEWLVLDRQGEDLLLLSLYGLDCQLYHADRGWAASQGWQNTVWSLSSASAAAPSKWSEWTWEITTASMPLSASHIMQGMSTRGLFSFPA